jgi:hypothetical protein
MNKDEIVNRDALVKALNTIVENTPAPGNFVCL